VGRLLSAFLALGAFVVALAFAAPARGADVVYGVVPQDGALPTQDDLKLMPEGGISSIRTILSWSTVESVQGSYDWSGTDEIVRQTTANGIKMFPFLYGTPAWAAAMDNRKCSGSECAVYPPKSAATREAFTQFSVAAAKRYGPGGAFWTVPVDQSKQLQLQLVPCQPPLIVPPLCDDPNDPPDPPQPPPGDPTPTVPPTPPTPTPSPLNPSLPPCQCTVERPIMTWQVWNEQNSPKYFAPKVSVSSYAKMLKSTGNAIHAAVPGTDVILGGMWGPDTAKKVVLPVRDYLTKLYKVKGIEKTFDSIALHPYSSSADGALDALKVAEQVVNKSGDRKVGSWITEIGWASGGPKDEPFNKGKTGQGKILKQAYKGFNKKKGKYNLRGIYWYSWRDKPGGDLICTWCGHAGLRAKNGTAKPAWNAFVKAAKP
jgi:Beta-galactosidase